MTGSLPFMVTQNLDFLKYPPASTLFIMVLCFGVTLITTYISRRTTNIEDYKRIQTESTHAQQELMAAMRSGNQRRIQRAQNRQKEVSQAQMKVSNSQMKSSLYLMVPLLIYWQILGSFFGREITVAYMPFDPVFFGMNLNYFSWYLLCSFCATTIYRRLLGLSFEIEPAKT